MFKQAVQEVQLEPEKIVQEEVNTEVKHDEPAPMTQQDKLATPPEEQPKEKPPTVLEVDQFEYAKMKVNRDLDINSSAAGRVLPISLKKFFRSGNE